MNMATKGQIYMMIAAMIILALSTLASIGIYTSLPVEKEQSTINSISSASHNINNELIYLMKDDPRNLTRINDFINFTIEFGKEKNLNISVGVNSSW